MPETRGDSESGATAEKRAEGDASGSAGTTKRQRKPKDNSGFDDMTPEKLKRRPTLLHEAQMLATLPRRKRDEFVLAAFWGWVASLPGAYIGYHDLTLNTHQQPIELDLLSIIITASATAALLIGILRLSRVETSTDYLKKLFEIEDDPPKSIWQKVNKCWEILSG